MISQENHSKVSGFLVTGFKIIFAAGQGLEPQYHAPEACVLPLDEPAIYAFFQELLKDTRNSLFIQVLSNQHRQQ